MVIQARPEPAPQQRGHDQGLTPQQRAAFEEEGYVVVPQVFPPAELEAIDQEIDRLLAEPGNDAGGIHPTWIFQVARKSELARRFAQDERLLSLVQDLVRPGWRSTPPSWFRNRPTRTTSATGTRTRPSTSTRTTRRP